MKILMLVNWNVKKTETIPNDIQSPDFYCIEEKYWFFKHWPESVEVDVIDIGKSWFTQNIEKKILKFYFLQTLNVLFKLKKYDVILSHGAQSGIFLALVRRLFFLKKPKHVLIDIGSFNSARESGIIHKIMRFASKSIDGIIYHTSSQKNYYQKCFPWLIEKSKFIPFGTDPEYFFYNENVEIQNTIVSVGYNKRDWQTLLKAFDLIERNDIKLKIIGRADLFTTNKNVIFQKYIPINQLAKEMEQSKFIVIPLEYMNYSYGQMTALQAMSLGKVVIAAKVPSLVDYIEDGISGLFYENGNVSDLASKMNLLLEEEKLLNEIGMNSRKIIENKLNEKEMSKQISEFLNSI
jgi:glycosyltransferase involved in cell wall biosynthesis